LLGKSSFKNGGREKKPSRDLPYSNGDKAQTGLVCLEGGDLESAAC